MGWAIRESTADDVPALVRALWSAFGNQQPTDAQLDGAREFLEVDRTFVAIDGDRVVGSGGAITLELTVPGPAPVPTAGVTFVGVVPTHRRQGILTAVMARVADDARRRGEPLAALLASESTIYRRFGYGVAVSAGMVEIERAYARMRQPVDIAGRMRLLDRKETADVLPAVYDRYRRQQPGEVSRTAGWWARRLADADNIRGGESGRFVAACAEPGGSVGGYVTYRVQNDWEGGIPGHTLIVEDLVATTPDVGAALWQYCFGVDLIKLVRASNVALDDPLPWMLVDPRRLRVTAVNDFLWIRVLDVEAALAARTYGSDGSLVLEVADGSGSDPGVAGRYRLDGGGGRPAGCRRTDEPPDLAIDAADLASAYLGGVRFTTLARAGLVGELVPGAVARADSLFASSPGPASSTPF
ncbi:MAG TPA: GNAT family N-acetyltransferase [Acidimicrobiales bacterium]|nr:GNAT family N-acetyltransferase [Acidimicrobiales bacterium]